MIIARRRRCTSLGMFGLLQIAKGRCMVFGLRSMVFDSGELARVSTVQKELRGNVRYRSVDIRNVSHSIVTMWLFHS